MYMIPSRELEFVELRGSCASGVRFYGMRAVLAGDATRFVGARTVTGGKAIIQRTSTARAAGVYAAALPVVTGPFGLWQAPSAPNARRPMVLRASRGMSMTLLVEVTRDGGGLRSPPFPSSRSTRLGSKPTYSREIVGHLR